MSQSNCPREFDFSLVIGGISALTPEIENALFNAGCDDATFSIQYGSLYAEFSRSSTSLAEAIISAIKNIKDAGIGAVVVSVDECNLVTQAEIAQRIGRTRQQVHQYITGERGPGNFPPPECHLTGNHPLWQWCAVSYWLAQNNIIRVQQSEDAEVTSIINSLLELSRQYRDSPEILKEIKDELFRDAPGMAGLISA
jgi:hypothetical protein